jgi:thiol reductant ABC exporter CydC subunit
VSTGARLRSIARPVRRTLVWSTLAAFGALASQILLMTVAPYLLARATAAVGFATVAVAVTGVRAFALGRAASRYAERSLSHAAALRILTEIRVRVFDVLERITPGWLPERRAGDLLARLDADVASMSDYFIRGLMPSVAIVASSLVACAILLGIEPTLGAVLAGALAVCGLVLSVATRRATRNPAAELTAARGVLTASIAETVEGMPELVAFGASDRAVQAIAQATAASQRASRRLASVTRTARALGLGIAASTAVLLLWLAIPRIGDGGAPAVFLATVPLVALAAFDGVLDIGDVYRDLEVSRAAASRTFALMDEPPTVTEPSAPLEPPGAADTVVFDRVSFRYRPDGPPVLDGLSLAIAPGAHLGIRGPSGAGKSTLVNLLVRFWDPIDGSIALDGVDVRRYRAQDVRALIGVVPQRTYLFNTTLRDNLLLADGAATDDELLDACERASLGPLLVRLPQALDTRVGEDGFALSGGERQRVAIARLFLRRAPIAVLDEATASLDARTERAVLEEVRSFAEERTLLVISHRREPLALVDRIVSLRPPS